MTIELSTEITLGSLGAFKGGNATRVATLNDGRFVVVWQETLVFPASGISDVDGAVFMRIFNADGSSASDAAQVNSTEDGTQNLPHVAALSDGGFVVSWTNNAPLGSGHNDTDIHARIYNADGSVRTADEIIVTVDDPTPGSREDDNEVGSLEPLSGGGFVVLWPAGADGRVLGRVFNNDGTERVAETQLFDEALILSDVTQLSNGDLVIVNDMSQSLRLSGADLSSTPSGVDGATGPHTVNLTDVPTGAIRPLLTALPGGGFAMTYLVIGGEDSSYRLQTFHEDGSLRASVDIPVERDLSLTRFHYDMLGLTNDVIAIVSVQSDSEDAGVYLRTYSADAELIDAPVLINSTETGAQREPHLTEVSPGRLFVSFTDFSNVAIGEATDLAHGRFVEIGDGGGGGATPITGTAAGDVLTGTAGDDTILGLEDADRLVGDAGNDSLDGGTGADTLNGGDGNDTILGGPAADDLRDIVYAGAGHDSIDAGAGNDLVFGQDGNDTIAGGAGVDELQGQDGDDVITGSNFSDLVFGGAGNDFVNGGFGSDRINGGSGADKFFHVGVEGHGSDWVQDYVAADGDVLLWGGGAATADDFQVNFAHTSNDAGERSGDDAVQEAFVIYRPTEQILWALVDGEGQGQINLQIGGDTFDLLV